MVNDVTIAGGILTCLILLSLVLPVVYDVESSDDAVLDAELGLNTAGNLADEDEFSFLGLAGSFFSGVWSLFVFLFSVLFYTFDIPVWANAVILIPMRVVLWFIIIRNLPFIGNGA